MSNEDEQILDQKTKTQRALDVLLADEHAADDKPVKPASAEAVSDALDDDEILGATVTEREHSRILIVTSDTRVLEESTLQHAEYLSLASRFDEMHVIVTASLRASKKIIKRYGDNLWLYTTGHVGWYMTPFALQELVKEQLVFAEGFRPDFIVVTDPFESAVGARMVAKKYQRPIQVHVKQAFWKPVFKQRLRENWWRQQIARWILKRVDSVRTSTHEIEAYISNNFKEISDLEVLPQHYSIKEIVAASKQSPDTKLFPQFEHVFLYIGKLDEHSTLYRVLDAARDRLLSPKTALVVVGEGSAKSEFQKRAEVLGIDKQIIFQPDTKELAPYIQSADVFICTDVTEASDELVIKAAAVGVPLLIAKTELREDLFTDGEDAFLCDPEDTQAFTLGISGFAEDEELRKHFKNNVQQTVLSRLHEDPETYYDSYRDTLEKVFYLG